MESTNDHEVYRLLTTAEGFLQNNNIPEATTMYLGILCQYPNHPAACNGLGWIHLNAFNQPQKARAYFEQALKDNPNYAPLYLNYAQLLRQEGAKDQLQQILEKALEIKDIDKAAVYNELGFLKEQALAFDEAIGTYQKAILHCMDLEQTYGLQDAIERCSLKKEFV